MSRIGLALLSTTSLLALAGCDTVQLDYKAPGSDSKEIVADAEDGYHYFELPRSYIVFTKAATGGTAPAPKAAPSSKPAHAETNVSGGSGNVPTNGGHGHGSVAGTQQQREHQSDQGGGSDTAPHLPNWPDQAIGPETWSVSVIPVASGDGLMVKGRVNYWQSTTLGVARYENSDMPSTVSSKAENLIAKRVGQIFSVAGDIATKLAPLLVDSTAQTSSGLEPFFIEVKGGNDHGTLNKDWDWKLVFDNEKSVDQAVSYDSLKKMATKGVGYWPVPACRAAVLSLIDKKTQNKSYDFPVTVGTPEWLRLEPLNVDGSLTLGSACSGSSKGTTDADPGTDAFNIADAFAKGIESLSTKPKNSPPANDK